jgi:cytochrome P450
MTDVPFAETKKQMVSGRLFSIPRLRLNYKAMGTAPLSFTADSLSAFKDADTNIYYNESTVKATAATMYVGGADTSVSALGTFILGLLSNPEVQQKAQAEVDSVTGGKRLPTFDDEAAMPYISAIVQETLRWQNIGPIGTHSFTHQPYLLTSAP